MRHEASDPDIGKLLLGRWKNLTYAIFEIARGSVTEVDAALDIAITLNCTSKEKLTELDSLLIRCFQMISKMI